MEPQPPLPGFAAITFDPAQCRADLDAFDQVLAANPDLSEREHILPFFRAHPQLALLLGTYNANIITLDRLAFPHWRRARPVPCERCTAYWRGKVPGGEDMRGQPTTTTITASDAARDWAEILGQVSRRETRVLVEQGGVPVAAIISADDLRRFQQLEAERQDDFRVLERIGAAFQDVAEDELEREIATAVAEVRAEMRAERMRGRDRLTGSS